MDEIRKAMHGLEESQRADGSASTITFEEYLAEIRDNPTQHVRNVHQVFYDMVHSYMGQGIDEYPEDPESINFISYNTHALFVENTDQPFFADRLFANRLMKLVDGMRGGAQQNKIYIFDGPPGCGKSIFLNNLLQRFQEYANSPAGCRYEVVWRLDRSLLERLPESDGLPALERLAALLEGHETGAGPILEPGEAQPRLDHGYLEVPCPSHDSPFLMIPKDQRSRFMDSLFHDDEFKWNLSYGKEYDWVFRRNPCTVCTTLFKALLHRIEDPAEVFKMVYARPYVVDRRLGEGVTVFNPGDRITRQPVLTNPQLQKRISALLQDSNEVRYLFSRFARTNNGIFALMDIKGHNKDRLHELHNIVSDGVHKVDEIEESINSLFVGVMNPEDNKSIRGMQSLSDRIEFVNISYVLDSSTEVEIYKNIFGHHIGEHFLPRVLENFARIIISSRLNENSTALTDWIENPEKYNLYCDKNLHLLKMAIYTGRIPDWLDQEDRKNFTAKRRRLIIAEAETEGHEGLSGRDALDIFQDLLSSFARDGAMITMDTLAQFFTRTRPELSKQLPEGFLDSLRNMYNYQTLQEVKESLYYYNEDQIQRDIQNYLFALNYEQGTTAVCSYTGDKLEITGSFLVGIENHLLGADVREGAREEFREETQREYTSRTLTQEIMVEGLELTETELYVDLYQRYVYSLKEKVLDPLLGNENFRRALKEYDTEDFKSHDQRIQDDVNYLITNLCDQYGYTELSARELCIYVLDNNLAEEFAD